MTRSVHAEQPLPGLSRTLAALSWAVVGCAAGATDRAPAVSPDAPARTAECTYEVRVTRAPGQLDVTARCSGFRLSGFVGKPRMMPFVTDVTVNGAAPPRVGARFTFAEAAEARAHYRVDLEAAARSEDDYDVALDIGASVLGPASSYLLAPDPAPPGARVTLRVAPGDAAFASGLEGSGGVAALLASEVPRATYTAFGRLDTAVIDVAGTRPGTPSHITVAFLDGAFAASRDDRLAWLRKAAEAVADYYGGFPVERATVLVAPIPERSRVLSGKVLPAGGNGIVVLVGALADRTALERDWILVHELFHLGFPSFVGEGLWLDEGLATYVEPLLRARVGLLTEAEAWAELTQGLPLGQSLCETVGLEHYGDDPRAAYWGGALVSLVADVEARRRSPGSGGLEGALRALLSQGGDARHVWPLPRVLSRLDASLGAPVLESLARAHAVRGSPVALEQVLAELGIEPTAGGVRLHDEAPLAAIRRDIVWGRTRAPEPSGAGRSPSRGESEAPPGKATAPGNPLH